MSLLNHETLTVIWPSSIFSSSDKSTWSEREVSYTFESPLTPCCRVCIGSQWQGLVSRRAAGWSLWGAAGVALCQTVGCRQLCNGPTAGHRWAHWPTWWHLGKIYLRKGTKCWEGRNERGNATVRWEGRAPRQSMYTPQGTEAYGGLS